MKKTSCVIVFLCVFLLVSCTAPTQGSEPLTDDCTQIIHPYTEEKADVTQAITEEIILETNDVETYPDTVFAYLSSEDIDTYVQSLGKELPFDLISGLFITETIVYSIVKESNMPSKTFSVADTEYTLPYDHSILPSVGHASSYDVYKDETGKIGFEVTRDGTLLQFYNSNLYRGNSQTRLSDENARLIADTFVSKNYSSIDMEVYTVTIQTIPGDSSNPPLTIILYNRVLHEYSINESIMIVINSDGVISSVTTDNLGLCDRYANVTDTHIAEAREQLINTIAYVGFLPINFEEHITLGSDGNMYMYMNGRGWTFNKQGMIDENSQEITVTYYVRLDP